MRHYFHLTKDTNFIKRQADLVDRCLSYIFDSEFEDFAEQPSDTHIYYSAYEACHGIKVAKEMLAEAIKDLE